MKTFPSPFFKLPSVRRETSRKQFAQFLILALTLIWSVNGVVLCCNAINASSMGGHPPLVMAGADGGHDHHAEQPDGEHHSHDADTGAPLSHCLQLTDVDIAAPPAIAPTFSRLQMPDVVIIPHRGTVQINVRRNPLSLAVYHPPPRSSYFLRTSRLQI